MQRLVQPSEARDRAAIVWFLYVANLEKSPNYAVLRPCPQTMPTSQ